MTYFAGNWYTRLLTTYSDPLYSDLFFSVAAAALTPPKRCFNGFLLGGRSKLQIFQHRFRCRSAAKMPCQRISYKGREGSDQFC